VPSITADHLDCIGGKTGKEPAPIVRVMPKDMGNPAIADLSMKLLVTLKGRRHTPRRVFRGLVGGQR
jgi:hypothetical protein